MFCGGRENFKDLSECYKFSFKDKNWEEVKLKFHLFTILSPNDSDSGSTIDI
jgi:hypothetical protein